MRTRRDRSSFFPCTTVSISGAMLWSCEDKADELETGVFYEGQRMAFESVLCLLFGVEAVTVMDQSTPTEVPA